MNKDALFLGSRSICGLNSIKTAVRTVGIPDKHGAGSSHVDNIHHPFGDLDAISAPCYLGNWASSNNGLKPDIVSCLDCQTFKVLWTKLNVWSSWNKNRKSLI